MATPPENHESQTSRSESALFSALLSHSAHQDSLLWSRVQLLVAVQGAVLAGSYALRGGFLPPLMLVTGAVLTGLIIALVEKDRLDRDGNRPLIDALAMRLLPADLRESHGFRFSAEPPKWFPFLRGRYILRTVLWGFLAADLLLSLIYAFLAVLRC